MVEVIRSVLIVVFLFSGVLCQPKPDDPSCSQGNTKKPMECCPMPMLIDQSILSRCITENPMTPPAAGAPRTEGCCIAQCVLVSLNAFKDNAIDKEAVRRALTSSTNSDANFSPALVGGVLDECYNLVNNNATFKATPVAATPGRPGCSFMPEALINCIKTTVFQRCPAAAWNGDAACNQLKQKVTSGCSYGSLMA